MKLSVIILNYNVKHFLEICIKSVQKAIKEIDGEIIVVDNASTDGSKEMMATVFPEITYLYLQENVGFPKGNNIGVNKAKGEFVCILNPDTVVAEDTFKMLLYQYNHLETPGILGCRLIDGSGNFLPESKRGVPTPWVAFTKVLSLYKMFPHSKNFNRYYSGHLKEEDTGAVDILVGAFMLMKRNLYQQIGGFDEGCFMYADDIDLSYLVLKEKKINYYVPATTVIHFKGESTLKDGKYMNRFKDAMQFFYQKHFKKSWWFNVLMNMGIALFAFKKKTEIYSDIIEIDHYIIVTNRQELFQKVSQLLKKPVDWVCFLQDVATIDQPTKNIEILVDAESISYKEYIQFINTNKNTNKSFKVRPIDSTFFIGSNDKNDRGEILSF